MALEMHCRGTVKDLALTHDVKAGSRDGKDGLEGRRRRAITPGACTLGASFRPRCCWGGINQGPAGKRLDKFEADNERKRAQTRFRGCTGQRPGRPGKLSGNREEKTSPRKIMPRYF